MTHIRIVPAILEKDGEHIAQKLQRIRQSHMADVQIDICDGRFVASQTFGATAHENDFAQLAHATNGLAMELDMMVDWDARFAQWCTAVHASQCQRLVVHNHSTRQYDEIFAQFGTRVIIGLGIHLDDDFAQIQTLLSKYPFAFVQAMGIARIGFGGQKLDERIYDQIAQIRAQYPEKEIAVDGGVKQYNAHKLIDAGATRLVAGSALFAQDDLSRAVRDFV